MVDKKRVAVLFGGRSVEHDISVVSGLQALAAIDGSRFDAFPVYVDFSGALWFGPALRERKNFIPDAAALANLDRVTLDVSTPGSPQFTSGKAPGLFGGKRATYPFDVALPVFHGTFGEDGSIQGLFDFYGIPYTGMRTMAAAVAMDKVATKLLLSGSGVQTLPHVLVERPQSGFIIGKDVLQGLLGDMAFPVIVKPATLGSSIGVALAKDIDELAAVLPGVLKLDNRAVVEPAVQNLVEYNVSVSRLFGQTGVSAIERPKSSSALLDFKEKYLSGSSTKKLGGASAAQNSGGMLSLTRDINPDMPADIREKVVAWSKIAFERLAGTGAPRIDFLSNRETGEVYLNEVNATPGSLAYFLWEAADTPVLFTEFLTALIEEGLRLKRPQSQFSDPVPEGARLFPKRG